MSTVAATRVRAVIEAPLGDAGFDVEDVAVRAAGKRQLVQVAVDKDGGVTLDDVADATRVISAALDDADPIAGTYVLEVTSRGVDAPLTLPRHWSRNAGRLVQVTRKDGSTVLGRIQAADDDGAEVLTENDEQTRVEFADVSKAKIQVEFSRAGTDEEGEDE